MNFLAHLYLSGNIENIITGNFIADHVKGKAILNYHPEIQKGIVLHRKIDTFTDNHPVFIQTRNRLIPGYKKYSGVIADMIYDHFLSANWESYTDESIDAFTSRMYKILMKQYFRLPSKTQRMLPFMAKSNWLKSYGTFEGLERALSGMEQRTPFPSRMSEAVADLREDYALYKNEFELFFPVVNTYVNEQLANMEMI